MPADDYALVEFLLAELTPVERDLFKAVANQPCGVSLLAFLTDRANTFSSVDSIAFRLDLPAEAVMTSLWGLFELGLANRLDVGPTLWRLTCDPDRAALAKDLIGWQKRWRIRLGRVHRVLQGASCDEPDCLEGRMSESCSEFPDCSRCTSDLLQAAELVQGE